MATQKSKTPVQVNWNFGEENAPKFFPQPDPTPASAPGSRPRRLGLAMLGAIILGAVIVGALTVSAQRNAEAQRAANFAAIQQSLTLESWAWQNGDWAALELVDPEARPEWITWVGQYSRGVRQWAASQAQRPVFQLVDLAEVANAAPDLLQATVALPNAEVPDKRAYGEVRFYRQVEGRWLRTAPPIQLWGESSQIQTAHFTLNVTPLDAAAAEALAIHLDAIYQDLRTRTGLDSGAARPGLTISVVADNMALNAGRFSGPTLIVLSPILNRQPAHIPASRQLAESVIYPLAGHLLAEAVSAQDATGINPGWYLVLRGVQSWLAQEVNPISPIPPTALPIPQAALDLYVETNGLPTLDALRVSRDPDFTWAAGWSSQAAHSLVAYAMTTYGPDKVDDLVAGLTQHESWETLIPALFGVTAGEFEAGWHAYLRAQW